MEQQKQRLSKAQINPSLDPQFSAEIQLSDGGANTSGSYNFSFPVDDARSESQFSGPTKVPACESGSQQPIAPGDDVSGSWPQSSVLAGSDGHLNTQPANLNCSQFHRIGLSSNSQAEPQLDVQDPSLNLSQFQLMEQMNPSVNSQPQLFDAEIDADLNSQSQLTATGEDLPAKRMAVVSRKRKPGASLALILFLSYLSLLSLSLSLSLSLCVCVCVCMCVCASFACFSSSPNVLCTIR